MIRKECANYRDGRCLAMDQVCRAVNPAYSSIHYGMINCDYLLETVLPLNAELRAAVWHEMFRLDEEAGEGWKECTCCGKPFLPACNRQKYCLACGERASKLRSRDKQRRYRQRCKTRGMQMETAGQEQTTGMEAQNNV